MMMRIFREKLRRDAACEVVITESLEGDNRIDSFRRTADEFVKSLSHFDSVEGILYIGGLARGFTDKHSDLDLIVIFNNDDSYARDFLNSLAAQHEDRSGIEVDIEIYYLEDYIAKDWDENVRWELSHAIYAYDRQGEVEKRIKLKLQIDEDAWKSRIAHPLVYISWYCSPPDDYIPSMIDLWRDRGSPLSAQYSVLYGLELVLQVVYALNREYLPAPKWRIFYVKYLDWIPDNFEAALQQIMLPSALTTDDAKERAKIVSKINFDLLNRADEVFGLDRDAIRKVYMRDVYGSLS
jgi:predicted nucleotidyltransferase